MASNRPMRTTNKSKLLTLFVLLSLVSVRTSAQTAAAQRLVTQPVDETQLTLLKGNTYPLARPQFDQGAAPASLPMERMLMLLKRSPEQETALETLLSQQQDTSSPSYHRWLTPQQFGQQFGPADEDVQAVTSWLASHGFQVTSISKGRTVIEFSGTASQVQEALHTAIHKFVVNGESHWANASDPQIPTALVPVVAGVVSLHNFPKKPAHHKIGTFQKTKDTGEVKAVTPLFTFPVTDGCALTPTVPCLALGPFDFATIYSVLPLWNATPAIDGTNQAIAVVGQSDISITDVQDFRSLFGLPANNPVITYNGPNPGLQAVTGDETESDLDVEWSGAVAKGATIQFVASESTETTAGVDLSAEYIVDNNLAPVLSYSYLACELSLGTAGNQFYNSMWQQGAAEGITISVATGDAGSANCDEGGNFAQSGLSVSGLASTPYDVAIGGTDFNDGANACTVPYWNCATTSSTPPVGASALGYIPETTWNDSCTSALTIAFLSAASAEANCNSSAANTDGFLIVAGGSGGVSNCTTYNGTNPADCTGGYAKPVWQTGNGVPADGKRDIPDVSLFSGNGIEASFYIVCEADAVPDNTCNVNSPYADFVGLGGTSSAAPTFAGMMALVNQKTGTRQGNANFVLYKLAAQTGASCASGSSAAPAAAGCVFNDVTTGTISMPCQKGSLNCTTTVATDTYGILSGYSATAGYDLATGLGSVNASTLVNKWTSGVSTQASATTLTTLSPTTITHGQSVNVGITVTSGGGTPTGQVALQTSTGLSVTDFTLSGGSISSSTILLPGGTYFVTANYPGDGTFEASASTPPGVSVTVNAEPSQTQVDVVTFNSNGQITSSNATTATYGSYLVRVNVTNSSGTPCVNQTFGSLQYEQQAYACPTGTVALTANSQAFDGGAFKLNSQGYTEDQSVTLSAGSYTLNAVYPGDPSFQTSTGTTSVTINKAVTTTALSASPATITSGASVTLTATVQTSSGGAAPTGTVTFMNGSTPLSGTVTYTPTAGSLNAGTSASLTATLTTAISSLPSSPAGPWRSPKSKYPVWPFALGALLFLLALLKMISANRRTYAYLGILLLVLVTAAMPGCGGGGGAGGGGGGTGTRTITATYSSDANYTSSSGQVIITID